MKTVTPGEIVQISRTRFWLSILKSNIKTKYVEIIRDIWLISLVKFTFIQKSNILRNTIIWLKHQPVKLVKAVKSHSGFGEVTIQLELECISVPSKRYTKQWL